MRLQETSIDIPLGRVAGLRGGAAGRPRVLALHGWLDNAASFAPLAEYLDDVELVAIDLPGHGRSVHLPAGANYTFELAVHHVLDVADALGWSRFGLLGHSMGAGIASLVAASVPERIEKLVCIEALGGLSDHAEHTAERLRESVRASRMLREKPLRVFERVEEAIQARMRANQMSAPVARLIVERGIRECEGGFVWSSDQRLMVPTFIRPVDEQIEVLVAGIECPARVVFADPAQPYLPDDVRRRYAACLPRGEMFVMPGTHHLHMETPAAVAAVAAEFLAGR
ncbi:alpha/beta hydrolase [Lysobacter pythonis]|uniref:Alpha/beta hydrolase n=1 Tax=Solilutibacter pythonis TaxID=2483112 RepID=A0A3M2HJS9_9GAMM|nr:alpha/beta hydrolase [Lysobacter pythonis]RMH88103.1 alpha/beta hydrolase [Lysobacter pythonis]